jgi:putative SOS response-associated peptidase YedK
MCGRFDNHLPKMLAWADMLGSWPDVPLSYNVAPSSQIAAFASESGESMRWGMVPAWSKEFSSKYATFNARVESVAEKPTFRNAWKRHQRCLIPMAGYYEWQAGPNGKQPFYITDRNVGGLVAAGLYECWAGEVNGEAQKFVSCTMITRPADRGLDRIHKRMPVLLTPSSGQQWLSNAGQEDFLIDCGSPEIVYWPVSTDVGNVRNNHPQLSQAIDLESK